VSDQLSIEAYLDSLSPLVDRNGNLRANCIDISWLSQQFPKDWLEYDQQYTFYNDRRRLGSRFFVAPTVMTTYDEWLEEDFSYA
jgi:hypothetical protein